MHSCENNKGSTPSGHSKFSNMMGLCFLVNSSQANLTKFHPTILGSQVLCSGSNTSFGFWVIKNPTLGTFNPKNSTSNSMYLDKGMHPPLVLFKSNKLYASATAPSAGPSHGLKYLLKYICHIRLTILPESSSEDMFSPIIVTFTFGHFATALLIILNWVCNELVDVYGPLTTLSFLSSAEPWILSPLIGLITNGGYFLPWSYVLVLPDSHEPIFSVATYNFPFHGWYLYNTSMTNWDLRTHLGLSITQKAY